MAKSGQVDFAYATKSAPYRNPELIPSDAGESGSQQFLREPLVLAAERPLQYSTRGAALSPPTRRPIPQRQRLHEHGDTWLGSHVAGTRNVAHGVFQKRARVDHRGSSLREYSP
jgi:hypothetical protein